MADLIVVSGPQAVGKMTVAEKIKEKTGYCLMTNHDSIEASGSIFGFGTVAWREFSNLFREKAFETAVKNNVNIIFTFVCAYDMPEDIEFLNCLSEMFERSGGSFYFVELYSDLETRLYRNETSHRLEKKPSKRNVEWSKNEILSTAEKHKLNTDEGEVLFKNHLKIDNSRLSPDEVADIVIAEFNLI